MGSIVFILSWWIRCILLQKNFQTLQPMHTTQVRLWSVSFIFFRQSSIIKKILLNFNLFLKDITGLKKYPSNGALERTKFCLLQLVKISVFARFTHQEMLMKVLWKLYSKRHTLPIHLLGKSNLSEKVSQKML